MTRNRWILIIALSIAGMAFVMAATYHQIIKADVEEEALPAARDEYEKLMSFFRNHDTALHMKGSIELLDGDKAGAIKEKTPFFLIRSGKSFHMALGYLQTISNGKLLVQLDTLNQYIAVAVLSDSMRLSSQNEILPFDQLIGDTSLFKTSAVVTRKGARRQLEMYSEKVPEIKQYRLIYDTAGYMIRTCEIDWWKDMQTDAGVRSSWTTRTQYQYLQNQSLNADSVIASVITIEGNAVAPAAAYQNYKLHIGF